MRQVMFTVYMDVFNTMLVFKIFKDMTMQTTNQTTCRLLYS